MPPVGPYRNQREGQSPPIASVHACPWPSPRPLRRPLPSSQPHPSVSVKVKRVSHRDKLYVNVNLKKGTYRVQVNAKYGYQGATSTPMALHK